MISPEAASTRREILSQAGLGLLAPSLPSACSTARRARHEPGVLLDDVHTGLNPGRVARVIRGA